jgi:hypothetical protein
VSPTRTLAIIPDADGSRALLVALLIEPEAG